MLVFYVIITNTMAYWYDGAALAATRSPVIALFLCLIKFISTTTTTTTNIIIATINSITLITHISIHEIAFNLKLCK